MNNKDTQLIWEAYDAPGGRPLNRGMGSSGNAPELYTFEGGRPISNDTMHASDTGISFTFYDSQETYYYAEAEIEWYGAYYRAKYSGTSAAEEPDSEPEVDGVNVVYAINQETDQPVDDATLKSIDEWINKQINNASVSEMERLGWKAPEEDYG